MARHDVPPAVSMPGLAPGQELALPDRNRIRDESGLKISRPVRAVPVRVRQRIPFHFDFLRDGKKMQPALARYRTDVGHLLDGRGR
jgi:hypothetical protein